MTVFQPSSTMTTKFAMKDSAKLLKLSLGE